MGWACEPGPGPGPNILAQEHFSETVSWKTWILYISLNPDFLIFFKKYRRRKMMKSGPSFAPRSLIWDRFRPENKNCFKGPFVTKLLWGTLMYLNCVQNTNNFSPWGARENAPNQLIKYRDSAGVIQGCLRIYHPSEGFPERDISSYARWETGLAREPCFSALPSAFPSASYIQVDIQARKLYLKVLLWFWGRGERYLEMETGVLHRISMRTSWA